MYILCYDLFVRGGLKIMKETAEFHVYLLKMSVCGIKNIDKDITLDFYKNTVDKNFNPDKYRIKGIYGENGVGKSAVIMAVKLFREIMLHKGYLGNEQNNSKLSYLINKKSNKAEFKAEYLYYTDDKKTMHIYEVGLVIKRNKQNNNFEIAEEYCYLRKGKDRSLVYYVGNGKLATSFENGAHEKIDEISKNLLKDNSLLSIVNYNRDSIDGSVKDVLENISVCLLVTYVYIDDKDLHNEYIFRKIYDKNKTITGRQSVNIMTVNPISVNKNQYKEFVKEISGLEKFIRIFKPDLKGIDIDKKENKDRYICELVFRYDEYSVYGEFESTGIKRLVELYNAFKFVSLGYVVFIDELDANIHDYYLCKLLEYVGEYCEGQLCFTTHNLGPMRVLKNYKKSIDFLSRDGEITSWIKNGNYQVDSLYKKGLIDKSPFNLEAFDFLEVF